MKKSSEFLNEAKKDELWKGVKILFWGGLGVAFVFVLRYLGVALDPILTALVALGTNAITFTAYRFFKNEKTSKTKKEKKNNIVETPET